DLPRLVSTNSFRHDLFFRLNVFQIHLPPLRERREDIPALAEHFLRRFEPSALPLLPQTIQFLLGLPWLGNVRELRNALEHAAILARGGRLLPEHFPLTANAAAANATDQLAASVRLWLAERIKERRPDAPVDLYAELLRSVEPALLEEVVRRLQGNGWVAARWLG